MSKILIVAEHAEGTLNGGVAKTVAAAKGVGGEIHVAVFAADAAAVAEQAAKLDGVTKVLAVNNAANANPVAAVLAPQIVEVASGLFGPCTAMTSLTCCTSSLAAIRGARSLPKVVPGTNTCV